VSTRFRFVARPSRRSVSSAASAGTTDEPPPKPERRLRSQGGLEQTAHRTHQSVSHRLEKNRSWWTLIPSLTVKKIYLQRMPESTKVTPLHHAERTSKQSRFESMPRVPYRMLMTGCSAAGKSTTISSLLLDHYRGVFENIYIFSSTVHLDPTFQALVRYGEQELQQGKTATPHL